MGGRGKSCLLPIWLLVWALPVAAAAVTIWSEDFDGPAIDGKGATGPDNQVDLEGVTKWSVNVGAAQLTAADDWFRVRDGVFEARDTDGTCVWSSVEIDISAHPCVTVSVALSEDGTAEADDHANVYFILDGGVATAFENSGINTGNFTSATASQSGLNGDTLQIVVRARNNAGTEYHRFDNVLVEEFAAGLPSVSITNPPGPVAAPHSVAYYDLSGSATTATVGYLSWTNRLTADNGSLTAATNWDLVGVALGVGDNFITVTGTNRAGTPASDSVLIIRQVVPGSFSDNFEDGDLSGWSQGTAGHWANSSSNPISANRSMQHAFGNAAGESSVYVRPLYLLAHNHIRWRFNLRTGNWDPSSDNRFWVYLMADGPELGGDTVDGYAVGVNLSGSDDIVRLWRVTDGGDDGVVVASFLDWGTNTIVAAGLEVQRSVTGKWDLSIDLDGGFDNLVYMGSGTDTAYTNPVCFGLFFDFTATRAGELWWDDVSITVVPGPSNMPPQLASIGNRDVLLAGTLQFPVTATDIDGDEITLSMSNAPAGATLVATNGNGTFTWTNAAPLGEYGPRFYAVDKDGTDSELIRITVMSGATTIWINELHGDNDGVDVDEGVEIGGRAGTDLSPFGLIFYNGNDGSVYDEVQLSGTIDDEGAHYGAVWFAVSGMQNGAPDGVALVHVSGATTSVVQFLSYEGAFTATDGPAQGMTSTDIGVDEDGPAPEVGLSLQLIGRGHIYDDFAWTGPVVASRGALNAGQEVPLRGTLLVFR